MTEEGRAVGWRTIRGPTMFSAHCRLHLGSVRRRGQPSRPLGSHPPPCASFLAPPLPGRSVLVRLYSSKGGEQKPREISTMALAFAMFSLVMGMGIYVWLNKWNFSPQSRKHLREALSAEKKGLDATEKFKLALKEALKNNSPSSREVTGLQVKLAEHQRSRNRVSEAIETYLGAADGYRLAGDVSRRCGCIREAFLMSPHSLPSGSAAPGGDAAGDTVASESILGQCLAPSIPDSIRGPLYEDLARVRTSHGNFDGALDALRNAEECLVSKKTGANPAISASSSSSSSSDLYEESSSPSSPSPWSGWWPWSSSADPCIKARLLTHKAAILLSQNLVEEALASARSSRKLAENECGEMIPSCANNLAEVLARAGMWEQAFVEMERAIEVARIRQDADAEKFVRGNLYEMKKEWKALQNQP